MCQLYLLVPVLIISTNDGKTGDDFIEKPFNLSLTIAKIQALLRRTYDLSVANDSLTVKGCTLILDEAKVVYQEQNIQLSLTELQILKLLFQNEDKYVSRTALIEKCWESENFIDDNTLAVNMTRLRKKLNTIGVNDFVSLQRKMSDVNYRVNAMTFL